jgi:hypothetical protein
MGVYKLQGNIISEYNCPARPVLLTFLKGLTRLGFSVATWPSRSATLAGAFHRDDCLKIGGFGEQLIRVDTKSTT